VNFDQMHQHIEEILALPGALQRSDVIDRVNWAYRYPAVEQLGPKAFGSPTYPALTTNIITYDLRALIVAWGGGATQYDTLVRVYEPIMFYDDKTALEVYTDAPSFWQKWGHKIKPGAATGKPVAALWVGYLSLVVAPAPDQNYQMQMHCLTRFPRIADDGEIADETMARYVCALAAQEWAITLGLDVAQQRAAALVAARYTEMQGSLANAMSGAALLQEM
jgi:hypothetical protein